MMVHVLSHHAKLGGNRMMHVGVGGCFILFVCTFVMLGHPMVLLISRITSTRDSVSICRPIYVRFAAFFVE